LLPLSELPPALATELFEVTWRLIEAASEKQIVPVISPMTGNNYFRLFHP
jgi:hypothetical protein